MSKPDAEWTATDAAKAARDSGWVARQRLAAQTALIRGALGDRDIGESPEGFLYKEGEILVRDVYLDRALQILGAADALYTGDDLPPVEAVVAGVQLVRLQPNRQVLETLTLLLDEGWPPQRLPGLGRGAAAPNHIVSIADAVSRCPAYEPEPAPTGPPEPPPTLDVAAGTGVRVVVVDTGLDPKAPGRHAWLTDVTGDDDPFITGGRLYKYAGHGTFIAGVIKCLAPAAEVHVMASFMTAGAVPETKLVRELETALTHQPDIINLSAGTRTFLGGGLLTLAAFNETLFSQHKGVVLIAAAGNDASRTTFWPAASPFAVSVGAIARDGHSRATFSNFGGWVDVYAPGHDLVNAFAVGPYTYDEAPNVAPNGTAARQETFTGMARWSGTSFAAPVVAGLVAARMSHTGENGRDAAAGLLRGARTAAKLGIGAILRPR
jgi:subtilisin family serine protease